jgi:hypothetical protein
MQELRLDSWDIPNVTALMKNLTSLENLKYIAYLKLRMTKVMLLKALSARDGTTTKPKES